MENIYFAVGFSLLVTVIFSCGLVMGYVLGRGDRGDRDEYAGD